MTALATVAGISLLLISGEATTMRRSMTSGTRSLRRNVAADRREPLDIDFFTGGDPEQPSPFELPSDDPRLHSEDIGRSYVRRVDGGFFVGKDWSQLETETGTWLEQSVNTSLTCKDPGCTATSTIVAFDGETEWGRNCKLNLDLHPTDFDDQYSGERLVWVKVNDVIVNQDCFPMVSGCNATTQDPTFSCISQLSLDSVINETGVLEISAQIPTVVDECPYEGNLLSGIPTVTCLVTPKVEPVKQVVIEKPTPVLYPWPKFVYASAPLRCITRNCTARVSVSLTAENIDDQLVKQIVLAEHEKNPLNFSQCLLGVKIYQTDFDNEEGTSELIDFVKVGGLIAGNSSNPGKNPCLNRWNGTRLPEADIMYQAVADFDVTDNVTAHNVVDVEAKISEFVDECAYEGWLLNGLVEVNCSVLPFQSQAEAQDTIMTQLASTQPKKNLRQQS